MSTTATDRNATLVTGVAIKAPCIAATTGNITLSGEQTIDDRAVVTGDRVLVRAQTSSVNNGIYVCDTGTWSRDTDFDGSRDAVTGTVVLVVYGTSYAGTFWRCTSTDDPIVFGTSAITFATSLVGQGDVVSNTSTSVDSEIALFSSTAGKTIKRASGSGLALITSGVLSATAPTAAGVMIGNGSSAPTTVAPSTSGNVLTSNGSAWASTAPVTSVIYGYLYSFVISSIAGNSTTATMTVSSGQATDSTNASMFAKASSTSWAVTNGNALNGYQGGTTLPNSDTIHMYVIATAADTTWAGTFASNSLTPTLPGSYTKYRRIGSFCTTGAGAPVPYTSIEISGGATLQYLTTQVEDVNNQQPASANRTLYALSVPTDIKVQPMFRVTTVTTTAGACIVTSPDETDVAPDTATTGNYYTHFTAVPGFDFGSGGSTGSSIYATGIVTTNTSAQIGIRQTGTTTLNLDTRGWVDWRR